MDSLELPFTIKHLSPFSYYHNGINYTVGGNKYRAYNDVEALLSQLSGSVVKSQMIEAMPLAQQKIALSNLPQAEKAEWSAYLTAYVGTLDDPSLIERARELLKLGEEALSAAPAGLLGGLTKPLIPIVVIFGVLLVSVLIFLPKIKTPYGSIEGRKSK